MPLYRTTGDLDAALDSFPALPLPDRLLMADPSEYDTVYAINPHMVDRSGALKVVDRGAARAQWNSLKRAFEAGGFQVDVALPLTGAPDLVFCANPVLPLSAAAARDGIPRAIEARMAHPERRSEVPHIAQTLSQLGYRREMLLGPAQRFEGMGDGLWWPGRRLLLGGVGPRTEFAAWEEIARRYDIPIVLLELVDPDFYHLDTALALLDERTCLWHPPAISAEGRALIERLVPHRIEADPHEARTRLACNAFGDGRGQIWIDAGATTTIERLRHADFRVSAVPTDEFLKAGGSVFCLKLAHGPLPARR